ncbi:MAG: cbb3-type cytochrome c oxidase subunit II, partial [Chloroflexota bacterium]
MAVWLQNVKALTVGSLFFLAAGVFVTIIIPSLDAQAYTPTEYAHAFTPDEARGRDIFKREGCWYCHTQQVRPPEANIGTVKLKGDIGPVSRPGDYVYQSPVFWGTERQGPDLTHVASRKDDKGFNYGGNVDWQIAHLIAPQEMNPGTVMPSFRHLPIDELRAVAAYLVT